MTYLFFLAAAVPIQKVGQMIAEVPEPGMMVLFGVGAGLVGLIMGRRKR